MAGRLEGRVAVITGGASGIGRACALRFAGEGADIVIADLNPERGGGVVAEVEGLGRKAKFVATDTSQEAACDALAQAAVDAFGHIDILVAAAGISHAQYVSGEAPARAAGGRESGFIVNKPPEHWEKVLNVNLTGVMLTDRAVARRMIDAGRGGSIINIASGAAAIPLPGAADYCVSKAGVWMLTKVLALEVARHNIRVNAIGPGYTETPMTEGMRGDEEMNNRIRSGIPLGRFGQPEDIANAALFLASDDASFFTGEILYADGGLFTG